MLGFNSISETAIGQLPEPFRHSNIFVTGVSATLSLTSVIVWGELIPSVTTTYSDITPGVSQTYTDITPGVSQIWVEETR